MASSTDEPETDIHAPFTKQELIDQLGELDNDITLLITHTRTAIQSLAQLQTSPTSPSDPSNNTISNLDAEDRLATFKDSMNAFLSTAHSLDVRLKRQIWGLEEAGIITLKGARETDGAAGPAAGSGAGSGGAEGPVKTSMEPDGVGKIGGLDVGWLNARSSKLERDMEAELWTGLREHLEAVVAGRIQVGDELFGRMEDRAAGGSEAQDVNMDE